VTPPDPGSVLRRALIVWGLGHLLVGRIGIGRALLAAEVVSLLLVAWLAIGLADSSAYLVPFGAGMAFLVAWAWQAVDAYRSAKARQAALPPTPARSPAAAIGWLSLPLLVWGTGFWLVGAQASSPSAVLDRFMTEWTSDELGDEWPPSAVAEAEAAADALGEGPDRFQDVRVTIVGRGADDAIAVAESIHFERRETTFLWIFPASELVPVPDEQILTIDLASSPVELPGGGEIGAVEWELISATR
jgi:hypothetical protein